MRLEWPVHFLDVLHQVVHALLQTHLHFRRIPDYKITKVEDLLPWPIFAMVTRSLSRVVPPTLRDPAVEGACHPKNSRAICVSALRLARWRMGSCTPDATPLGGLELPGAGRYRIT